MKIKKGDLYQYVENSTNFYTTYKVYEVVDSNATQVFITDDENDSHLWGINKFKDSFIKYIPEETTISSNVVSAFKEITEHMADTYERKNHDYGNSFDKSLDEFGLIAAVVRMEDKMNRIKSLIKKEAKVKDESIKDTLLDLANYSIMTYMWLNNQK